MKRFFRILRYATYPFLAFSLLLALGTIFGIALIADFTIENRTDEIIAVTPIGSIGPQGYRAPLPVKLVPSPALTAFRSGSFRLAPGESITIYYDMDDINFSEIVVEAERGRMLQLVTNPDPTSHRYHAPRQRHFVIDDLSQLEPVPARVQTAVTVANRQRILACVEYSLLFGPWLVYSILSWLSGRWERPWGARQALGQTGLT